MEENSEPSSARGEEMRKEVYDRRKLLRRGSEPLRRAIFMKSKVRLVLVTIALMSAGFLVALDINILG